MKLMLIFVLCTFSLAASADRFQSKIHSIDVSLEKGVPHLIKLENARVIFVRFNDKKTLRSFQESLKNSLLLELETDDKYNFVSAVSVNDPIPLMSEQPAFDEPDPVPASFTPTVLTSTQASNIFRRMRKNYRKESQCYNRAHVWQYEEFRRTGLNSQKMFLFFTNSYIRTYRFGWWFHTAPMVLVKQNRKTVQKILDRKYMGGTRLVRSWTNFFVRSKRGCPTIKRFTDYSRRQKTQHCYIMPVSHHFWQPRDIEARDNGDYLKTEFVQWELNVAFWDAFRQK